MSRFIDYRDYDATRFAGDHPDDPWLKEAERAAAEASERAHGPQGAETDLDARRRVDQAFDTLATDFADRMALYGRGEAAFMKQDFIDRGAQEIWNDHLPAIETGRSLEDRNGARFSRDLAIRLFRERIEDNPTLAKERQQLQDMHTTRSTVVDAMIGHHHDAALERLGLDQVREVAAPRPEAERKQKLFETALRQGQVQDKERDLER